MGPTQLGFQFPQLAANDLPRDPVLADDQIDPREFAANRQITQGKIDLRVLAQDLAYLGQRDSASLESVQYGPLLVVELESGVGFQRVTGPAQGIASSMDHGWSGGFLPVRGWPASTGARPFLLLLESLRSVERLAPSPLRIGRGGPAWGRRSPGVRLHAGVRRDWARSCPGPAALAERPA